MMKKLSLLFFTIFFTISLVACGFETPSEETPGEETEGEVEYEVTYSSVTLHENSIGTFWVDVIVEVTNTSTIDLYLDSGSIDIENASGTLVDVLKYVSVYPQIISPGEKAYYFENTIVDNVSATTNLSAILHPDIEKSVTEQIYFPVTEVVLTDDQYGDIRATGRVENTSTEDESMLYVVIVLFNANDKPVAVLRTYVDANAGEKLGFSATALSISDDITSLSVTRYEAYAYPSQYQFLF